MLKHYWNQRIHSKLNRKFALDLLNWGRYNKLKEEIAKEEQLKIKEPLLELLEDDLNDKNKNIYIYPAMWNKLDIRIPKNSIVLQDTLVIEALPEAHERTLKIIKELE